MEPARPNRPTDGAGVLVIGGANVDVLARSGAPVVAGTSNPGTTTFGNGGVGRNVAENLARLGTRTRLVAAVGRDPLGERLLAETAAAGVDVTLVRRTSTATGTYTAVLDGDGELVVAVSDMAATDELTPDDVRRVAADVAAAELLVLDGNLSPGTVAAAAELAAGHGVPVVLEPVSVPKAERLRPVLAGGYALVGPHPEPGRARRADPDAGRHRRRAGGRRRGPPRPGGRARVGPARRRGVDALQQRPRAGATCRPSPPRSSTSPAPGTPCSAAFCHALLAGRSPVDAARLGHAAAALTVAVPHSVRPDLSADLVEALATRSSS